MLAEDFKLTTAEARSMLRELVSTKFVLYLFFSDGEFYRYSSYVSCRLSLLWRGVPFGMLAEDVIGVTQV